MRCLSSVRGTSSCRLETPLGRDEEEIPSTGQSPAAPSQLTWQQPNSKVSVSSVLISKLYGDQARFFDQEKVPRIKHRKRGTVSMVNNGSGQHGSQVRTSPFASSADLKYRSSISQTSRGTPNIIAIPVQTRKRCPI